MGKIAVPLEPCTLVVAFKRGKATLEKIFSFRRGRSKGMCNKCSCIASDFFLLALAITGDDDLEWTRLIFFAGGWSMTGRFVRVATDFLWFRTDLLTRRLRILAFSRLMT